jgi:serine/threonine protein phosphatase 1
VPSSPRLIAQVLARVLARMLAPLFGLRPSAPPIDDRHLPLARPHPPVCIIGDVHGMADLLETLLAQIARQPSMAQPRLIFAGDLIDRGPQSAAVLARVRGLCLHDPAHHICLMGNHERMLLDALGDPSLAPDQITGDQIADFARWLAVGGAETCDSFGVPAQIYRRPKGPVPKGSAPDSQTLQTAQALRAAMGPDLLNWLQALPLYWQEGDIAVSHAGADLTLPMADQDPDTLIWGPSAKRRRKGGGKTGPQTDPQSGPRWVVHGHVIVPQVDVTGVASSGAGSSGGRHIGIDTGAYRTGRLSALWLDQNGAKVIEANG